MNTRTSLSLDQLEASVLEALRLWHASDTKGSPFQELRLFRTVQQQTNGGVRHASNQLLRQELVLLKRADPEKSAVLQLRFGDELAAHLVATRQNISEATVWRWQQEGIRLIADSLFAQETKLREGQRQMVQTRLPAPIYAHLIGVDRHLEQLSTHLLHSDPPWLLAIEGMGGIGKTTLAHALTHHFIEQDHWEDVAWVTAQQRVMNLGGGIKSIEKPALTVEAMVEALFAQLWLGQTPQGMTYDGRLHALESRLKNAPHLLIVDNLETHLDVESLLVTLRRFAGPSKILLTTRQRLLSEADIFHFDLPELVEADALQLVRYEAQMRNLPEVIHASDGDLHPIYAAVGGNPLALRLVVGQLHTHTLDRVLDDLKAARGLPVANLYTYIYRQAWETLNEDERQALILMLLTSERGESFAELNAIATGQLDEDGLRNALDRLVALSLIDACGGLRQRQYAIHSLTRSFLHRQVLKWEEAG